MLFSITSFGQIIRVQTGVSSTEFEWVDQPMSYEPSNQATRDKYFYVGFDYVNKEYFNLSSNIGYLSKSDNGQLYTPCGGNGACIYNVKTTLNYLSLNTTLDVKYTTNIGIVPFVSFGPRVDVLVSNESDFLSFFYNSSNVNRTLYGITLGAGLKYRLSKIEMGFRVDCLSNFNNTADLKFSGNNKIYEFSERSRLYGLLIGYRIK